MSGCLGSVENETPPNRWDGCLDSSSRRYRLPYLSLALSTSASLNGLVRLMLVSTQATSLFAALLSNSNKAYLTAHSKGSFRAAG